jgi:hypothetical protein
MAVNDIYQNLVNPGYSVGPFIFVGGLLELEDDYSKITFELLLPELPAQDQLNIVKIQGPTGANASVFKLVNLFNELDTEPKRVAARANLGVDAAGAGGGAGVTDGDKGDVVVSGTGAVWLIDSGLLTTYSRSLTAQTNVAGWRSTLGLGTAAVVDTTAFEAAGAVATHVAAGDPHPQYLTPAEGNAIYQAIGSYAPLSHTHIIGDVTGLQAALDLKAPLASPTFTGTVGGITATMVGLGNVNNTSDANKPVSSANQTALNLKADLASPTFTGTVGGITKAMVGLANVDNTSDANKPVSTTQQTAIDVAKARANHTGTQAIATIAAAASGVLFGRNTGGAGAGEEVTPTQVTALLGLFTSLLKGLVPASGGGTSNFLRADGSWTPPPTGSGTFAPPVVEVDLGSQGKRSGRFVIPGVGLTIGKPVIVQQSAGPYTGKGTLADEAEMDRLNVNGSVTSATEITCYWGCRTRVRGNFKFAYAIGG